MPITWADADISPQELQANSELAGFTWEEFSVAYDAYLKRGGYSGKDYQKFYQKYPDL